MRISWSIGSEKALGHVPPVGVEPSTSCVQGEHPSTLSTRPGSPLEKRKKKQSQKMNIYRIKGQRLRDTERNISTNFNT